MTDAKIIPFQATPVSTITATSQKCRSAFNSQRSKPLAWRLKQLRALYWAVCDNEEAILAACLKDLNKSSYETHLAEVDWVKNDIVFVQNNLEKWMKDESAPDMPLTNKLLSPHIRKEPLGAVLILGCWNFPVQLLIGPLIGAIAAGCTAVSKPSEVSPATAMICGKIIQQALDPEAYPVVQGGVDETTALLNEKWDKIFYTGNAQVGTIIAKKAAETLTPVCLELGGRNPAIITRNADLRIAARRLLWGKFFNAGQVCISHNYTMVDKECLTAFVEELKTAMAEFYPNGAKNSPDFSRIVNSRHFGRIRKMLDSTSGKIVIGGEVDEASNFIAPTVIIVNDTSDSLITDESFGPLMPILAINNLDEAIRLANEVHSTPLGLYAFGSKQETNRILNEVTSGGASINDAFFHGSIPTLAFGGVGDSGQGAYRGKASFDVFTHRRSVVTTPSWMEGLLSVRYPPYAGKLSKLQAGSTLKPNFDRQGKTVKGLAYWLGILTSLGGENVLSSLTRWVLVALLATVSKRYLDNKGLPSYIR